jgi:methyltransferase (TIGR00027 family)
MSASMADEPESTAVRVALWRAMHVQADAPPHVLTDEIGLRLADPGQDWRDRPDMHPAGTSGFRAWIVARARFVEDLVTEHAPAQYVILGAGLDTFAQRQPGIAARMTIFEIDQPGPQAWKRRRLAELGYPAPDWPRFVPVDFEQDSWWDRLAAAGFDPGRPALVASAGVSMYLSNEANRAMLDQLASLASGSSVVMTFQLPLELIDPGDRPGRELAVAGARASGTPFVSFYTPGEMVKLSHEAGFSGARHIPSRLLGERYFASRTDGLRPSTGEDLLIATT